VTGSLFVQDSKKKKDKVEDKKKEEKGTGRTKREKLQE